MRRVLFVLVAVLLLAGAFAGGFVTGTQRGAQGAFETAAADRAAFASRPVGSAVVGGGGAGAGAGAVAMGGFGGQGAGGGQGAAGGAAGGAMGGAMGAGGRGMGMAGAGGSAAAGTPAPMIGNVTGRVLSVDGPALRVQGGDNAAVNVATSGSTLFQKLVAATMGDLKVNDFVTVQGDRGGDGAITARTITSANPQAMAGNAVAGYPGAIGITPPAGGAGVGAGMGGMNMGGMGGVAGRITQMSGTTLTLMTPGNMTITVNTNATTKVQTTQPTSLQEIRVGDTLVVVGERTSDNGISARSVINQGGGNG